MMTKDYLDKKSQARNVATENWTPLQYYKYYVLASNIVFDTLNYLGFRGFDCVLEKGFLLFHYRDGRLRNDRTPHNSMCFGVLNTFEDTGKFIHDAGSQAVKFLENDSRVKVVKNWQSSSYYTEGGLVLATDNIHESENLNFKVVHFHMRGYNNLVFGIEFYRYVEHGDSVSQTYNRNQSVTFPTSIYRSRGSVDVFGFKIPTIANPEKWLEVYYGSDWSTPVGLDEYHKGAYGWENSG